MPSGRGSDHFRAHPSPQAGDLLVPPADRIDIAALDPFVGYKAAIDDRLADAVAVLDTFHVAEQKRSTANGA